MLFRHPRLAILHLLDGWRKATHPRELTRAQRLGPRKNTRNQNSKNTDRESTP
jgi:hypothetical protein